MNADEKCIEYISNSGKKTIISLKELIDFYQIRLVGSKLVIMTFSDDQNAQTIKDHAHEIVAYLKERRKNRLEILQ